MITAEVILFWFQGLKEELREEFRQAYLSVREIKFDEELIEIYRLVHLSRLLMIFDDENKVDRIRDKIESLV